ncbi:MAG TPA: monovalent cation:proton antiporter-2 (CPA2) family protein [Xanthobacteraceae bacterium]|nr:monovalent cation:proton antiporter-2 (CPA2) family protein [Xanthobacteraceae bacterium]
MNSPPEDFGFLSFGLVLLGACVVSVPIARRLRLSPVVAYLAAGAIIGPWGIGIFRAPSTILTVAELGVVMMMFVIGLELELSRLMAMRRDIFGLGAAQLALTAAVIGGLAVACGLVTWRAAIIAGLALALSTTAIALEILEERGDLHLAYGQRAFAILLFQDMAVVPLIALLPLIAPGGADHGDLASAAAAVALVAAAIAAVVVAGRYLLNPLFRLLSETGAREVMTAAALLVVLGAALLMHAVGMSMALGAFLAGVLLAESNYRHELEADIEPFRGLLLALFFISVGMSIDLEVVRAHPWLIVVAALAITVLKAAIVGALFRATCVRRGDSLRAGSVLTGAGEFAFVLFPLGVSLGVLKPDQQSLLAAVAAATMLLGPPVAALSDIAIRRRLRGGEPEPEEFDGVTGSVLMIGFGRFGQIVSQCLLVEGVDVTAIDSSPGMIQNAGRFGFKVYYGDGTRLDVLRAAGAGNARLIAVCIDDREAANRIVEMARLEFPGVKLYVRSYDRVHTLELIERGVDYELRETYESALVFARHALEALGLDAERAQEVEEEVRKRDLDRLALQQAGDAAAAAELSPYRTLPHEPFSAPKRKAVPLNPEADDIIRQETEVSG